MADQDKPDEEEVIEDNQEEVETGKTEDENEEVQDNAEESESQDQEQEENESDEDESKDEPKTEDEEESKFQKRFTQIKGETLEEYKANLEEAYRQSSTEGQRNATELKEAKSELDKIGAAIAADPELAKVLNDALEGNTPAQKREDPALEYARSEMKKKMDGEYNNFTELHPNMVTDAELREKVLNELSFFADIAAAKGQELGMEDGLKKAWISLGLDDEDSKEDIINKAKELSNKPDTSGKTKTTKSAPAFTEAQISLAKRYGLTSEQLAQNSK